MLTQQDIQAITEKNNLVLRNLQITQGYFRLSQGMRRLVSRHNVSWVTFATHASKTAGQALRHEMIPHLLKSAMIRLAGYQNTVKYLNDVLVGPDLALTHAHHNFLSHVLKDVSLLVSEGNLKVFAELASPFASLIETFYHDWAYDDRKLQEFLDEQFRTGPLETGGQDYLIEAFRAYYDARFETDSKRKSEYILKANLLIGLHEQIRLQPYIKQSLSVPMHAFFDRHVEFNAEELQKADLGALKPVSSRQIVTGVVTQMLMTITLPNRQLKLGKNVVAPTGIISFPVDLRSIEEPRCRALVEQFDSGLDTLSGSAAGDWGSLMDRMNFIVDFFRSHQQNTHLFEPPFNESQVTFIEAGQIPVGPL